MKDIRDKEDILLNKFMDKNMRLYPEEWRTISIYGKNTKYLCSNYGRIATNKIIKGKEIFFILRSIRMPSGYYVVTIRHEGTSIRDYIHRIVAKAYLERPNHLSEIPFEKLEVNHKNGKEKWNNSIWNLEWVNSNENKKHAYDTGLRNQGEKSGLSIYEESTINDVCSLLCENELSVPQISRLTNVSEQTIYDILYGKSWKSVSKYYDFSSYKAKNSKYDKESINNAIEMLKNGYSSPEISEITCIPKSTIYYYKEKYKL